MSHGKLRTENNCLNCNAVVNGRYCSVCGQQNIEPRETFWQLTTHFVYDLFHYDGQFFSTVKTLLFKPGVLTYEYVRGKRASYLHPIRLYVFTSAIFFIIFISIIVGEKKSEDNIQQFSLEQFGAINKTVDQLKDTLAKVSDSTQKQNIQKEIIALQKVPHFFSAQQRASLSTKMKLDSADINAIDSSDDSGIGFNEPYKSIDDYNEKQAKLTADKRDGWFMRSLNVKLLKIHEEAKYNTEGFTESLKEHFLHSLPTMMFISLPVTALIFQLLYIRKRKSFTYVQHGVFVVHVYCAAYLFILLINVFSIGSKYAAFSWLAFFEVISIFLLVYYVFKAMKNFYQQSTGKTILKLFIFSITYSLLLIFLTIIFSVTSLIQS